MYTKVIRITADYVTFALSWLVACRYGSIVCSTEMGDHLYAAIPPLYVTKPARPTQPCIPPGLLN